MYREVAQDAPEIRFDEVTPFTGALEALGFSRLARVTVGTAKASAQVWVSREGDAFAEPEWMPGRRPMLTFRTALADGAIVQTSTPREGGVRFVPFWTRQHHPGGGYFLEERAGMPHELWVRHRERVAEVARQRGAAVAAHAPVSQFLSMADRAVRQARSRTRLAQVIGVAVFLGAAIPATLFGGEHQRLLLAATAPLWFAVTWGVFRLILRTGWPKLKPPPAA